MLDTKLISKYFSQMNWLYNVIDVFNPCELNAVLIEICRKQVKGIVPFDEYKALGKLNGYESIDYGFYLSNIKYDLEYYNDNHYETMKRVLYFLQNADEEIFEIKNRFILNELVLKLTDYYLNNRDVVIKKSKVPEITISRLLSFSNRKRNSQTVYFWLVDICVLNELNRIINYKKYVDKFYYENGKLTLLCGIYDSSELQFSIKKYMDRIFGVVYMDNMIEFARRDFISGITGIETHDIYEYKIDSLELELIKKANKYIHNNIRLVAYDWDYKKFDLDLMDVDNCDFILVYRLKKWMKNKNLIIEKLRGYAIRINKPVVIVYHCGYIAEHDICLDYIKEINQENFDYIYGFLPGVIGFKKIK